MQLRYPGRRRGWRPAGTKLDAAALAILYSAGIEEIEVIKKAWITIFFTGDELTEPGTPLARGKVYSANGRYLAIQLQQMCAEILFHGVAIKPGSPALFATLKKTPILALSGNPFAAMVSFELLGRALVSALHGDKRLNLHHIEGILMNNFHKASSTRRFVRAKLGMQGIFLPRGHSNGQIKSMVGCNCLVDIPAGSGPLSSGSKVCVIML